MLSTMQSYRSKLCLVLKITRQLVSSAVQLGMYGKLPTTLPLNFNAKVYHHQLHNCTMQSIIQDKILNLHYASPFCTCSFYKNLEEILHRLFLPSLSLPFNTIRESFNSRTFNQMQKQQKYFHFIKNIASTSEVQKNDSPLQKDYNRQML